MDNDKKKSPILSWNDIRRWLPGTLISLTLLAVIFYYIDLNQVIESLVQADYRMLLIAIAISIIWLIVRGIVWWTLLKRRSAYGSTFLCMCEGYLLNNFLPFRLGEVGRAFLLSRKSDLRFMEVIPTVVIERVFDLMFAAGILLLSVPYVLGVTGADQIGLIIGVIMLVGIVALFLMAFNRQWVEGILDKLENRWPGFSRVKVSLVAPFFDGLSVLTDIRILIAFIFWMTLNWVIAIIQYYLLVRAFFPEATIIWGMFSLGMASFGGAVPSLPGAIGTMDSAVGGALVLLSQNIDSAAAFLVVLRLINYLVTGIPALIALGSEGNTISGLYRDITQFRKRIKSEQMEQR